MNASRLFLIAAVIVPLIFGCNDNDENVSPVNETLNQEILSAFSDNLAKATYADLKTKTETLHTRILALEAGGATEIELTACRESWRQARGSWEQSEAFLFGPVSMENIDPRIDTWPVNFVDLDAQLVSGNSFTEAYIDNLEDALKGFHPIEYLIFGETGEKAASALTSRDLEYLKALSLNLKTLTASLVESWNIASSASYYHEFVKAGSGSKFYTTQRAAFEELVAAMSGICNEVANGKISEPFTQSDPTLEESPFARNSITDFTNNIKGVQNVYLGKYTVDGKGLEDLVKNNNLQLDSDIKLKMNAAITTLNTITVPFGRAITEQPIQVQNAIDAINDLNKILEEQLKPFVQQHTK